MGRPTKPAAAAEVEADADDGDDGGQAAEEIGRTFVYRNVLNDRETAALDSFRRRAQEDEPEALPLNVKQRNATYGDVRQPLASRPLGSDAEALCIAASHSGNVLAVGGRHGTVQILNPHTLDQMDVISMPELAESGCGSGSGPGPAGGAFGAPSFARQPSRKVGGLLSSRDGVITSLAFRPDLPTSKMQNVLLAAQGEAVVHLHVGTRRVVHTCVEPGNKINTLSMRADGKMFATAGSDCVVRVYDEATCAVTVTLDHGDGVTTTGHTNHVFSLAWQPDDPQVLLSGGWDNRVLVWDLRVQRSVRSISGPHICGDALDAQASGGGCAVLTGSWRNATPLQLWDLGSGRLLTNLPWFQPEPDACLIYAARFGTGAGAGTIIAGGSGSRPMVRVYRVKGAGNIELQHTVLLQRPVHALAQMHSNLAAAGNGHGHGGGGGAAGAAAAGGPTVVVCCDTEVHAVALAAHVPHPHPHK